MAVINNNNNKNCFHISQTPRGNKKRKHVGKTLPFVSNEANQTDCVALTWFPSGGLMGNVVSLSLN